MVPRKTLVDSSLMEESSVKDMKDLGSLHEKLDFGVPKQYLMSPCFCVWLLLESYGIVVFCFCPVLLLLPTFGLRKIREKLPTFVGHQLVQDFVTSTSTNSTGTTVDGRNPAPAVIPEILQTWDILICNQYQLVSRISDEPLTHH